MTEAVTPQDDSLHPPTNDDPYWSETHWFSFDQPGPDISATIYPVWRPNLGIAHLAVYIWDASSHEPWLVRYGKAYWHLPLPGMDVTRLRLGDLEYDCVEPLRSWDVRYRDGVQAAFELRFEALREPHVPRKTADGGHMDQPCRVQGELRLGSDVYAIDTLGMRDKSWGPRPDARTGNPAPGGVTGGAYTYGNISADEQFLAYSLMTGNEGTLRPGGYLVRDGIKAGLSVGTRRVSQRVNGYPVELQLEMTDDLGRTLTVTGRCINRLANQAFPTTFAWMSMTHWRANTGQEFLGEDQEVFPPFSLGPALAALNTGGGRE